ncbi:MAG: DNA-processing protein DprA [Clostridiales bacterium]|nr:DNA-processing protein DprA [Clostridiales bacterium]
MKCPPEYWIWLQMTLGAGARTDDILMFFGNPEKLYEAGRAEWLQSGVISVKTANRLTEFSPSQSYKIMKDCKDNGWSIVTYEDDCYPPLLREIYGFPSVLYVWGDPSVLKSEITVSIVGTRNASEYGIRVAENLAYELAQAGVVVVSGGAVGIDSASHRGAVNAGGKTVAVLGCGLGHSYLKVNEDLRKVISKNGAVVSEYTPFSPPTKQTFPVRNRLIAGMSLGTVVVEAGERSGSLITANFALEQGRDVFAVPGDVTGKRTLGANRLIRDGARPVFSAMDVLDNYFEPSSEKGKSSDIYKPLESPVRRYAKPKPVNQLTWNNQAYAENNKEKVKRNGSEKSNLEKTKTVKNKRASADEEQVNSQNPPKKEEKQIQLPDYASDNAKKLFAAMTAEPMTADELVMKTKMPVQDVLSALTELEIYKATEMHSGKRYAVAN